MRRDELNQGFIHRFRRLDRQHMPGAGDNTEKGIRDLGHHLLGHGRCRAGIKFARDNERRHRDVLEFVGNEMVGGYENLTDVFPRLI